HARGRAAGVVCVALGWRAVCGANDSGQRQPDRTRSLCADRRSGTIKRNEAVMYWNRLKHVELYVFSLWLTIANAIGQGFLVVDQASGTLDEIVTVATPLPDNQIAQSFTPLIPAVGFVQFSQNLPAFPGNDQVSFVVNLRQGAYNGPIISSTDPVVLVNHLTQISTFYFPANIQVSPGQLYFFEPVLQSSGFLDIGYKNPSSYFGGDAWNNGLQDTGDYWFREGIVVPEPDSVWLL